jgi:hypothetical protein
MTTEAFNGFVEIDDGARDGQPHLVGEPASGEVAAAYWTGSMWAYDIPTMVQQLDFEPTHYRPRVLV